MKHCPNCKRDLAEDEFYSEPKRPGGLSSNCKECKRERSQRNSAAWYAANKPRHIAYVAEARRKRRAQNPPQAIS